MRRDIRSLPVTQPLLDHLAQELPDVHFRAYDGCLSGPVSASTRVVFKSPLALVRIVRAPRGLGLARAWVAGEIDIEGDLHFIATHEERLYSPQLMATALSLALRTVRALGVGQLVSAGPTGVEYSALRPGRHSISRDLEEANFHYGRSAEFYRRILGPAMAYSPGVFLEAGDSLEEAQARKNELICHRLGIGHDSTVLDIGCGWGSFLRYANSHRGCRGVGLTASLTQYRAARESSGSRGEVDILYGDYRQILPIIDVTAAASIGMYEHVGKANSAKFFELVRACLPPKALYLNESIVRRASGTSRIRRNSFVQRYIFPNGQLISLPDQLGDLERAKFRIVSVEMGGQDYARTLRHWIRNLKDSWSACAEIEGEERLRAWYMYLTGSLTRFEEGSIDLARVTAEAI